MTIYINIISDISENNKYFLWWKSIIQNALDRSITRNHATEILGYCEGHHIVPISFDLGGETDPANIAYLTAKEHIMIHRLMCKFLSNEYRVKSLRAFHCMCWKDNGGQNKRTASLHHLAKARQAVSEANKGKRGIKGVPVWFGNDNMEYFIDTIQDLVDNNYSDPEIGSMYNVSATTIHNWRNKLGIKNRRNELRDKEWLYKQYINKKLSAQKIANDIGCSGTAVQQYLNKFGIPIRDANERQQNRTVNT